MAARCVYDVRNWEMADVSGGVIILRPGMWVVGRRLGATFLILMGCLALWAVNSSLSGLMETGRLSENARMFLWMVMGFMSALAAIPPVSCLWNRLCLEKTPRGVLSVVHRGVIWSSRREWAISDFERIAPGIKEVMRSSRYQRCYVWLYSVNLSPRARGGAFLEFRLSEQTEPMALYHPEVVRRFAEALAYLTGLPAVGFDDKAQAPASVSSGTWESISVPATTRQVFNSLEEAPPELRARFAQLKAEAERAGKTSMTSETITISQNGEMRAYHSVEEMPPELRARYKRIKRLAQSRDASGRVKKISDNIIIETSEGEMNF